MIKERHAKGVGFVCSCGILLLCSNVALYSISEWLCSQVLTLLLILTMMWRAMNTNECLGFFPNNVSSLCSVFQAPETEKFSRPSLNSSNG